MSHTESLAKSSQGATDIENGPFPLYMAKLAGVHLAEDRVKEIRCEMKDLQEQLTLVALLNELRKLRKWFQVSLWI